MKTIPGFENYLIIKAGRIWTKTRKRIKGHWMKPWLNRGGRSIIGLCKNGVVYRYLVHRLSENCNKETLGAFVG